MRTDGVRGLWRGLSAALLRTAMVCIAFAFPPLLPSVCALFSSACKIRSAIRFFDGTSRRRPGFYSRSNEDGR